MLTSSQAYSTEWSWIEWENCYWLLQTINIWKWLKLVHKRKSRPFTADSPLPPDLLLKVKAFSVQLNDDPFEVKLRDNYEVQEWHHWKHLSKHCSKVRRVWNKLVFDGFYTMVFVKLVDFFISSCWWMSTLRVKKGRRCWMLKLRSWGRPTFSYLVITTCYFYSHLLICIFLYLSRKSCSQPAMSACHV